MAKEPTALEIDFKKLTEHILNSYLNSNSEEDMEVLKLLDESMSVIGTGKQEFFRNLQEFSKAFLFEVEQREKIQFEWKNFEINEQKIDEEHMLVYGRVLIRGTFPDSDVCIRMDSRFTILYGLVDGIWKVQHIHHSVPDKEQMENEEFPRTLGQQIIESQSMITALTSDYRNVYVVEPEMNLGSILKLEGYVVDGINETPKNFTYSEMLRRYAVNRVCDEDRTAFLQLFLPESLIKSFADGRERLELNYRVPVSGRLEHYSGLFIRISKKTEPLKLIAGFRCTEDIITIQSKTRKEGMYNAYEALSDLYLAMFRINTKENTYASIKTTEAILKHTIPDSNSYDKNLKAIITALADEESLASALDFLDLNTIEERMRGKKHIFVYFNGKVAGLCKLHLIKEDSDADGNSSYVILAIEALKEAAKSYKKLDEMHEILAASKMGTWNIYLLDGQNPKMEADDLMQELLGVAGKKLTPEEVYDAWFSNITPAALQSVLDSVEKMKNEGRDENTYLWKHPVLGEHYVRCGGTAKPVEGGFVLRGYHYDVDEMVREQKQKDEALAHALETAQKANKAKTIFLSSMSHDIRTPMNAIVGFTALARAHSNDQAQVQDYLGKISASSTHLLSLINDILDMSRIESSGIKIEEEQVHLPGLLKDISAIVQPDIEAKQMNFFIDTNEITNEDVMCDQLHLSQILLNLLSNAVKYTPPGGSISIRVVQKIFERPEYACYEFTVKDNGIGMSDEFQAHVFEPFTREQTGTVSGIQGTGLGMAITKNIVDMMGGTISVHSKKNVGTDFVVMMQFGICKEADKSDVPDRTNALKTELDLRGKKILLAEDNELNREIVTSILEDVGVEVTSVKDGIEAVEAAAASVPGQYDLILMDIQMPLMDGYTATREIRTLKNPGIADIPIIALTANAFDSDRQKALKTGMNGHITKPISIEKLMEVMREVLS